MRLKNLVIVLNAMDECGYKSFTDIHHETMLSYVCLKNILDFLYEKKLINKAPSHDQRFRSMLRLNKRGDEIKQRIGGWFE